MTQPELTEAQREQRRQQARTAIETGLRDTINTWHQTPPRLDWAADAALDALGDLAAEILVDGTMMRSLTIRDGVATLELAEATELVRIWAAGMRGMLDGHGAENYVETEMTTPSVSMDVTEGGTGESYTVTIQRRAGMTPHAFRQKAERERDRILHIVADWHRSSEGRDVLVEDLGQAGFPLPAPTVDPS